LCTDLVATPSNYDDAYFEISYVRVFTKSVFLFPIVPNRIADVNIDDSGTSHTGSSPGTGSSGSNGSNGSSMPYSSNSLLTFLGAVVLPIIITLFS
jgi:hypothetical protein